MDKLDFIKLKNFCLAELGEGGKSLSRSGRKYFLNHMSDMISVLRVHKENFKHTDKKTIQLNE